MDRSSGNQSSDSGKNSKRSKISRMYYSCFPALKRIEVPPPDHAATQQQADIAPDQQRRPSDGPERRASEARTQPEAGHGEGTQEHTNIKQIVNEKLNEGKKTFEETPHLLSEIQEACDELRKYNDTRLNQLADKIVNISDHASKEIDKHSLILQNACKELENAGNRLETFRKVSLDVQKRFTKEIDKHLASVQKACDELEKTKDRLKTLRDFSHIRKQVNEARTQLEADFGEATDGDTRRIKELADKIINRITKNFNELYTKIVNEPEKVSNEFLDNPWRLQNVKEAVNQLDALREASHAWKEAHQIKAESIETLSEKRKGAAGMRVEMANTAFELFLSYFEHKDMRQSDKTRLKKAGEQLKSLVKADLYDKWYELANFRNQNHMQRQVPTETVYEQLHSSVEKGDFTQARKLVNQLAEDTLKSYEFDAKEVNLSRRTRMVDSLRTLLDMRKEHRPERVNKIVKEFNETLGKMKEKLDAVPKEAKDKLVETTIAIMKDFKESYNDAVRGYGKRKGRTAREGGEEKIKELNGQLNTLNETISSYKQIHEIQTEVVEDLWDSKKGDAESVVNDADRTFKQLLNQRENWQSLKERIEGAHRTLTDLVKTKIESKSEEVPINKRIINSESTITEEEDRIIINIEKFTIPKKGFIKEISSATAKGEHNLNEDSCFVSEYGSGVFDGVSQGGRGAEASRMTKGILERELSKLSDKIKSGEVQTEHINDVLKQITLDANNEINNKLNNEIQLENNNNERARTTLSVVMPIGDRKMMAVNVGDSRVYVLTKAGQLKHITTDDGILSSDKEGIRVMEQEGYPFANVLANSIKGNKLSEGEQKEIQDKVAKMSENDIKELKTKIESNYDTAKAISREINTVDTETGLMKINKDWNTIVNEELIDKGKLSLEEIKMGLVIMYGRYIGNSLGDVDTEPNIVTFDVNPGDRVIITSDGVHDNLNDQEIIDCVSKCKTVEDAAKALVKTALEKSLDETRSRRKQGDDTTVVVVECSGEGKNIE